LSLASRGFKTAPTFDKENEDKINKLDLEAYLDDLMKRRPATKGGYIHLPKENFRKMVLKARSEADLKTLTFAHVNYLGHRNILPQAYLD
jgi:hypothetical protein